MLPVSVLFHIHAGPIALPLLNLDTGTVLARMKDWTYSSVAGQFPSFKFIFNRYLVYQEKRYTIQASKEGGLYFYKCGTA